ncbi:MAG: phosphate ABC transporter permease PstA [Cyanobacteria bacterium P01_A01_bin.123]
MASSKQLRSPLSSQAALSGYQCDRCWQDLLLEQCMMGLLGLASLIPVLILLTILGVFVSETYAFFQTVNPIQLLSDRQWTPLFTNQQFGIWVIVSATLLVTAIAMTVAIPLGVLAAIYLSDYARGMTRQLLKTALEALAGIPTIVYGYFALLFVTPRLQSFIPDMSGFNALSAGLMTGVLITPIISSLSEDALRGVPGSLRQAAYAMGMTKQEVIITVVLPVALPGIMASFTLAASRALGETMIAAIAAGQYPGFNLNPLKPVETITTFIVQVSLGNIDADEPIFHTIFFVGAVLFLITLSLNSFGYGLIRRHKFALGNISIPAAEVTVPEATVDGATVDYERIGTPGLKVGSANPKEPVLSKRAIATRSSPLPFQSRYGWRMALNRGLALVGCAAALLGIVIFVLLLLVTFRTGFLVFDWGFLTHAAARTAGESGIFPALMGTLWVLGLTALIAFPIGISAALYLEEYVPESWFSRLLEINLANATAIPGIIYGLLGLALFVRDWRGVTGGASILSAGLTMAVVALPLMMTTARNAIHGVPAHLKQAGYSVGMSRWQVVWHVILPAALPNLITGMLMALARVVGEAAPLIAIGAVAFITFAPAPSWGGLQSSFTTLPTQIFYWASRPQAEFQANASAAVIILGGLVLILTGISVWLRDRSANSTASD